MAFEVHEKYIFLRFVITVDAKQWSEVIGLYPAILECVTCSSYDVRVALKEALLEFKDLLSPPRQS